MLAGLSIRDVVLIERLDLSFGKGLSVLTGETGAGKSILLDALGLALGARAESGLVRHGASQATVAASFAPPDGHPVEAVLGELGIAQEDDLVLRRTLSADGRSRAFVNDQPVSVGALRRIGDLLVEVQGQFEQRGLLDPATHLETLDAFGRLGTLLQATATHWRAWRDAARAHADARADLDRARAEEDLLRHAVAELDSLAPKAGEEHELATLRSMLANAEQVIQAMSEAADALSGDSGAEARLAAARRLVDRVADKAGGRLDEVVAALDRAAAELDEARQGLAAAAADIETDAGRLEEVDDRLHALRAVARKHGVAADDLPSLHRRLAGTLADLDEQGGNIAALARTEAAARKAYVAAAEALGTARREAALRLDRAVAVELPPLRLEKAGFTTRIERQDEPSWSADGMDHVVFEVATNPGTPAGPLHRIASGGELARFLLALKVVLAEASPIETLVFDEVDSGVGGAVAAAVGERLSRLGDGVQVLVVTHSPQVAAKGAWHWHVAKQVNGEAVSTMVAALDPAARREEIARMLSGARVTDEARAAADSLLDRRLAV